MSAQRGYYELNSAADVIERRIAAIRSTIPAGSTILDVGCNDGTIGRALLESGHASQVIGVDLEDIVEPRHPNMRVIVGNIGRMVLDELPRTDGVLLLNVLHHVVGRSRERAKTVLEYFLNYADFVMLDMGSFTEQGEWGWRQAFNSHWKCDGEMWDDLFATAGRRFKMLRYPTQGKGTRTLWKLVRHPRLPRSLEVVQRYRRNVAAWPRAKRLYPVENESDAPVPFGKAPYQLWPHVMFHLLRSETADLYWAKKYLSKKAVAKHLREMQIYHSLSRESFRIDHPVMNHPEFGVVFVFDPELFDGEIVHYHDIEKFFDPNEVAQIGELANYVIKGETGRVIDMVDFQTVRTSEGLKFIDFTPGARRVRRATDETTLTETNDAIHVRVLQRARAILARVVRQGNGIGKSP